MKPKIIVQELSIKRPFFWGLAATILSLGVLSLFWSKLPPQVPIFFSRPRGEAQLGTTITLFIPIGISLLLLVFNSIFAQYLNSYPLLRKIVILGATAACFLSAITVIRIIFLIL